MICGEAQELITAVVDGELPEAERALLETHLHACANCRTALDEEKAVKKQIQAARGNLHAPAQLRERILSDRRIFPTDTRIKRSWRDVFWLGHVTARHAWVTALGLIAMASILYLANFRRQPLALAALDAYELYLRDELPVFAAPTPIEIERQLTLAVGGRFHPMGYDLADMSLYPVAGAVREIQGRKILVAIYRGPGGSLLCYTFQGSETDAPPNAARFVDPGKKVSFYAFSRAGVNAVLHREKDVICILASEMPMEELVGLARSKTSPS